MRNSNSLPLNKWCTKSATDDFKQLFNVFSFKTHHRYDII